MEGCRDSWNKCVKPGLSLETSRKFRFANVWETTISDPKTVASRYASHVVSQAEPAPVQASPSSDADEGQDVACTSPWKTS